MLREILERPQEKSKSGPSSIGNDCVCRKVCVEHVQIAEDNSIMNRVNSVYLIPHVSPERIGYSTIRVIIRPIIYRDTSKTRSWLTGHQSCSSIRGLSQNHFDPCDL